MGDSATNRHLMLPNKMYHATNGLFVESLIKTPQIIAKITGCFPQPVGKSYC